MICLYRSESLWHVVGEVHGGVVIGDSVVGMAEDSGAGALGLWNQLTFEEEEEEMSAQGTPWPYEGSCERKKKEKGRKPKRKENKTSGCGRE